MNFLDMRTVIFSHVITDVVCALVMAFLWSQNRKRFAGISWWVFDFALQTAAVVLVVLRGSIPDWISMALANTLVMAGALCGYLGLERFVGDMRSQVHNYALLAAFAGVHTYLTVGQPNLAARTLNLSLGLLIFCGQCAWLMLRRVEPGMRPLTRGVGLVFGVYGLVSLVRMIEFFTAPHPNNDFFQSRAFETLVLLTYQILLILLTYSLALMVNGRLILELRRQEAKFTTAFHSSPYAITLTRLSDGQIFEVNNGFVNLSGYQADEIIGKTTPELRLWAHEDDRQQVVNILSQHQPIHEQEYQFRQKSGAFITGLFSAEILTINNQPCVLSSISDITARKQAEEKLRKSEKRLREAQEMAHLGFWQWDMKTGEVEWSDEVFKIFGLDPQAFTPRIDSILALSPWPEDHLRDQELINRAIANHGPGCYEQKFLRPDQSIGYYYSTFQGNYAENDQLLSIVGTVLDITARKRAEENLRNLLRRYETLLAAVPEIIMEVNLNKVYTWANQAGIEFFGADVPGKEAADFFEDTQETYETVQPIFDGGEQTIYIESWQRRKDGEKRLLAWWCRALKDGSGNVIGAISSARDITERKRAEENLRASEARYKSLVETQSDVIARSDQDGRLTFVNDAYCEIFGKSRDALLGHVFTPTVFAEDLSTVMAMLQAIQSPPYRMQTETRHPTVLGIRWFSWDNTAVLDESGNILELQGIGRDITERKRAEEALRESEDKFKYVFDHSVIGKSITLPSGEISVNQAFCEMLGYTLEELQHHRWQDFTHPDDLELTQRAIDPLLTGEKTSVRFSKRYLHKDGSVVWADVSTSLRRDQDGKPLYFMTAVNNITARKRAEAERERLMAELAQKNYELEQIVYVTSHDLRSPLVNVQGFSKELQHAVQDLTALLQSAEVPEHIRTKAAGLVTDDIQVDLYYILTSIAKMDTLLAGLLKLSRLGRTALAITTLDMNTLLANVLNTFRFQIQEARVRVEVTELPFCQGDAAQINQVFSNLVDNALKYLDIARPGVIKIGGYAQEAQVIYCVADNGIGIAPQHQQKIFEIFHRLNPDYTPGEGLGLTIVRKLLERQGGKVWVESEPGQGSKFYVSLPRG